MDLAIVHQRLVADLRADMAIVLEKPPLDELSPLLEQLSEKFEGLALCHLLESLDATECRENLCRSGHARRYFLTESRNAGHPDDPCLGVSRTKAFLASVAAGDLALALDLARLSVHGWNPHWEYEDDYCYAAFLESVVIDPASFPRPDQIALLDQYERARQGVFDPRLVLCRALAARDIAAFDAAIERVLEEIQTEIDAERDTTMVKEEERVEFWPKSYISIEGLALLALGALVGVRVARDLPLCPPDARFAPQANNFQDFFVGI